MSLRSGSSGASEGPTIGVLGRPWRATLTPWGDVVPWDDGPPLSWFVAAEDRWHRPAEEPTTRQHRLDGTPVVETRLRVPGGDVVQRVWAVADGPGYTVVELENDSPRSVAVVLTRADVLTSRPPADVPIEGIEVPPGSIALPIGHRTSVRVAVAHDGSGPGPLPGELPSPVQVARGWLAVAERASRLVLPDAAEVEAMTATRCELALTGPGDPDADPSAFVLGVHELVRMGDPAPPWVPDVVTATERVLRRARRSSAVAWDDDRVLLAAASVLHAAGEERGVADIGAARVRLGDRTSATPVRPDGVRGLAWLEDRLCRPLAAGHCALLPAGIPSEWQGASFEAYRLTGAPGHAVSFAVRWHGARPAVLWEVEGGPGLVLRSGVDPSWHTSDVRGEGLWAAPGDRGV